MISLGNAPVIIIGAPRSGTNIIRDVIVTNNNFTTWPCDEINYVWRYKNLEYPYQGPFQHHLNI